MEAADADLAGALESARDARVRLIAEVARNYVDYRAFEARLAIARENVRIQQETVEVSASRVDAGVSGELELAQARSQLESSRAQIPTLISGMRQAGYRLDVLLGAPPGRLADELGAAASIPTIAAPTSIGAPADLIRRRPDVRAAERAVAAAAARVGVATADLYPRFTLTGSFGFESNRFDRLFDADSRTWGIGPFQVRWPIFDAGRLRAALAVSDSLQEQALISYERVVLEAYEEAASALVDHAQLRERNAALERAVAASRDSVDLASDLWTQGLTDFLNVLQTQENLFDLEDQLAASRADAATNLIALYKALGGGWDASASLDPPPAPDDR